MNKVDIAEVAYEAITSYKSVYENSGPWKSWMQITKEERDSYIVGVEWVMNNPATTAEHQHNAWMKHKQDTGWLWGKEKDEKLRTHPLLIPFSKLTLDHKTKDELFIATVKSLLPMQSFIGG